MTACSSGFVFSISPAKKHVKKNNKDEEKYMLILAPFNKAPKVNLGQVKIHDIVEKSVLIVNPQDFTLKLNIKNADLNIDNIEVEIERQGNIDFKIKWQPDKADSYKFSIIFEVLNSRLKFLVHAFGICVEPPKKKVYKNLTILQPIRPVLKPQQQPTVIEARLQSKPSESKSKKLENNKENNFGIIKSNFEMRDYAETTYVVGNSLEHFENLLDHAREETINHTIDLQRRQTEVLQTPKFNTKFNLNFNEINSMVHASNNNAESISSASISNINQILNDLQTPKFIESIKNLRRSISETNLVSNKKTNLPHRFDENEEMPTTPKLKLNFNDLNDILKQSSENLNDKKDELNEIVLSNIKRKYAALKIQRTFRNYKKRLNNIKIENEKKENDKIRRNHAAIIIQRKYREYKTRQIEKLVFTLRAKFSAIKIQRAYNAYKKRLFEISVQKIRENNAARVIQKYVKKYLNHKKLVNSSNIIKRYWHAYKFRKSLNFFRNAAIKIQRWTRLMKDRYNYLRFRRVIIYFQQQYKRKYNQRVLAALKIQSFYRLYKYRVYIKERVVRLNHAATLIQSLWRGYRTRKEINIPRIHNIRERLSVYIQKPQQSHFTLGFRIKRSLNVLEQNSPFIQQIITALMDLQVVTRLSKECCVHFANSGAISILYDFISRCNRSTPHMDLIKLCLEILINLSKCVQTSELIVIFDHKIKENNIEILCSNNLTLLLNLLQAYQLSNTQIFMNVCILLIILASNQKLQVLREAILQQFYLKKLLQLYTTMERRFNFRSRNQRPASVSSNQDLLNESINSSILMANNLIQEFTLEPDWSLSKKLCTIQLPDPLFALQYLLVNTLNVKIDVTENCYKTPKKLTSNTLFSSAKKLKHSSTGSIEHLNHVTSSVTVNESKKSIAKSSTGNNGKFMSSRQSASLKNINAAIELESKNPLKFVKNTNESNENIKEKKIVEKSIKKVTLESINSKSVLISKKN